LKCVRGCGVNGQTIQKSMKIFGFTPLLVADKKHTTKDNNICTWMFNIFSNRHHAKCTYCKWVDLGTKNTPHKNNHAMICCWCLQKLLLETHLIMCCCEKCVTALKNACSDTLIPTWQTKWALRHVLMAA
jgi:hypothetical protein